MILSYEEIDREEWSRLVRTSATGTWFQTPEAYCFYESMPEFFRPFVVGIASPQPSPKGKGEIPTPDPSPIKKECFASIWGAHTADSTQYSISKENAQVNRKKPTEAESVMWSILKGNNLGLHFRRQHIILDYIVDFICVDKGLIIELDGEYHDNKEQKEYDERRTAHLQNLGYTELRFKNEEILCAPEKVVARIKSVATSLPSFQGRDGDRPQLRGVCVGYVTKEKNAIKQYFTRRAIIIGGPALADDASSEEIEALLCALKSSLLSGRDGVGLPPIYIETRNFNDYSRWKEAFEKAGFEYQKHLNFHVDCTDKEAMWERMSENRCRQVRKAHATVECLMNEGISELDVREWYEILKELYRTKVRTPLWPVEFFLEAYRQGIGKFMIVRHEGKIIGGSMVVRDEGVKELGGRLGSVYEWFECGMNAQYKDQYPSVCATYAGMCYAAENGMARYDMMGAGEPGVPYGVRDFKAEFGGKMVEHGRFEYICKPLLYKIGTIGVKVLKKFKI